MFFLDFIHKIKAPDWFVQDYQRVDELQREVESLVSIDVTKAIDGAKTLEEAISKGVQQIATLLKNGKVPSREKMERAEAVKNYMESIMQNAWCRFRYENYDTDFGKANKLHYNRQSQLIEIKK
ncbi:MAG: hypothetical protein [Siphoviridae sp. cttb18]|nr:MAG: hypothetical protein [Siphoviridae sp. cttb18]